MSKFLFDEFQSVTAKEWKQKVQFDLKGADYNKTLLTNTNEGITIKPFYHQDEFNKLEVPASTSEFIICQSIFINDEKTANTLAINALKKGVNAIKFIADKEFDYEILLNKIFPTSHKNITIYFQLQFIDRDFIVVLMDLSEEEKVYVNIDLIGNFVKTGNWYFDFNKDFEILKLVLKKAQNTIGVLSVEVSHYQNSGANIVQQVAYALSHAKYYLDFLFDLKKNKDLELYQIEDIIKNMQFNFAIGGNYFFEIAKLRAFRVLWQLLLQEYKLSSNANIFAEPSLRNKTIYDYNVNMLRTTTECMSAVLGGADTINNSAYDAVFHKKNKFGERIARNQLIILKEESNLINDDFAEGSYYIEEITSEIANKALTIFKGIERKGGFIKQLFEGTIQRKIHESAKIEQQEFDSRKLVLLGTNMHLNEEDFMKNDLEIYPFVRKNKHETEINPIIAKRLSEDVEQYRLIKEVSR